MTIGLGWTRRLAIITFAYNSPLWHLVMSFLLQNDSDNLYCKWRSNAGILNFWFVVSFWLQSTESFDFDRFQLLVWHSHHEMIGTVIIIGENLYNQVLVLFIYHYYYYSWRICALFLQCLSIASKWEAGGMTASI